MTHRTEKSILLSSDDGLHHKPSPEDAGLQPKRTLGAIGLGFVAFVGVCGGPFGIEEAVGAAGPLPTLISLLVLGIFWALPQALMTAELSTIFDENGGYIVWVHASLGRYWGSINSFNSVLSNLCDLPLYPVLYSSYVARFIGLGTGGEWGVKAFSLVLVVVVNIIGLEAVAASSAIFTVVLLAPFVIEPFLEAPSVASWGEVAPSIDWSVFVAAVLWNYQGWDSLGCIAGEVKNGKRSYPLGILIALVLITINYALPVTVGLAVEPEWWKWGTDSDTVDLVDIATKVANWVGIWVLLGASLSVLGEFTAVMSSSSRAMQRMASYELLPHFLVKNMTRWATPVPCILAEAAITAILMSFDFSTLVVMDTFFNNISLTLEVISFLYLKHKFPNLRRPYAVPGQLWGAWIISIPKFLMIGYAIYTMGLTWQLGLGIGLNVLIAILAYVWTFKFMQKKDMKRRATESRMSDLDVLCSPSNVVKSPPLEPDTFVAYDTEYICDDEDTVKFNDNYGAGSPSKGGSTDIDSGERSSDDRDGEKFGSSGRDDLNKRSKRHNSFTDTLRAFVHSTSDILAPKTMIRRRASTAEISNSEAEQFTLLSNSELPALSSERRHSAGTQTRATGQHYDASRAGASLLEDRYGSIKGYNSFSTSSPSGVNENAHVRGSSE